MVLVRPAHVPTRSGDGVAAYELVVAGATKEVPIWLLALLPAGVGIGLGTPARSASSYTPCPWRGSSPRWWSGRRSALPASGESNLRPFMRARGQRFESSPNTCKEASFGASPMTDLAVSPLSVHGCANAQADWPHEKDLQTQAFLRAAEGIRTLDLLHGKQTL
jgi:hypothetical protein